MLLYGRRATVGDMLNGVAAVALVAAYALEALSRFIAG